MLEQFIKDLLHAKGLDKVEPAVYADLVDELILKAQQFLNTRMVQAMDDSQLSLFEQLMKSNPDQVAIDQFLAKEMPERDAVAAEAMLEFKELYLGVAV